MATALRTLDRDGMHIEIRSVKHYPKCERCWHHSETVGVHDYWPTYKICSRCVRVLLEMHWPPYIPFPGEENDYYICKSEAEWHRIKTGKQPMPERANV